MRFRIWRAPTGIEVRLEETGVPVGEGYEFAFLGDREGDVNELVGRLQEHAEREIGRLYLERATHRAGWMVGDEVAGRFVGNDEGATGTPYNVLTDERIEEARTDADVIEMPFRRNG